MKKFLLATGLLASIGCTSQLESFSNERAQASISGGDPDSPRLPASSTAISKTDNPFKCEPGKDPVKDKMRRLNKREYSATLQDLFGATLSIASLKTEIDQIDRESKSLEIMFDTSTSAPISLKLIRAYSGVAAKAADLLAAENIKMNAIAGSDCISLLSVTDQCLDTLLDGFGYRAYRRPLTATEKNLYRTLYRTGTSGRDSFARVVETLLQAPPFLYHLTDQGTPVDGRADLLSLSQHEIASRLSYMILGSMPDATLFNAARSNALTTPAQIRAQAARLAMLPRAKEHIREFFLQWLDVKELPPLALSVEAAQGINADEFRTEAQQEISELIDEVIWNRQGGLDQLFTTPLIAARGPALAAVYGMPQSTVVQTTTEPHRKGILSRAAFLAGRTGNSSPINRGVRIRTRLLCDHLGAPPADAVSRAAQVDPLSSTRTQITAKTSSGECMSCHGHINGLGFAMDNFDGLGRFRKTESIFFNNQQAIHEINARVMAHVNSATEPDIEGSAQLQDAMIAGNKASSCLTEQYYEFQVGRHASAEDGCELREMFSILNSSNGSSIEMFKAFASAKYLRLKKID